MGASSSDHEQHIADLQARVSFQEDALASLDEIVARQDRELLMLKAQMKSLVDKLKDLQFGMEAGGGHTDERPPHY
ncbi:SlyX family protein [Halioxenophilus aromaticivorans]|uniref:Protein SlyX homolog n=1 Tax=Halioxenophilus aromaticivorans TaxID=1306992 RepID=A0AAV3TZN7_9ALTE